MHLETVIKGVCIPLQKLYSKPKVLHAPLLLDSRSLLSFYAQDLGAPFFPAHLASKDSVELDR